MAGIKERLIQVVLRGKDMLSGEAGKSAAALDALRQTGERLQLALGRAEGASKLANQLDQTRTVVERASTTYSKAKADVARLRAELDAAPGSKGLQTSLREAERYARSAGRELDRLRGAEAKLEQQTRDAGIATDDLGAEQDRLQRETDDAKRAINENAEALDKLRRESSSAARASAEHASRVSAARQAMSGGMHTIIGYAAAYVSLEAAIGLANRATGAIRDGIVSMLRTGDEFEGMESRLTSLMGSIEAGQQATAWIKDFAKTTPLSLEEVINSFALLRSYGVDPMDGSLKRLVDKSEQLGGGMERLTGIVTALGQANAKGKLQTEEVLQLVERGVPVWDMLATVTGKNAEQLQELATQGRLGRDVIAALIVEMGKSADGAAASGMSRLSGLLSNLKDSAASFMDRIADAGALDFVKGKLSAVSGTLDRMDKDGRLDRLATALSNAFVVGAEAAENFVRMLLKMNRQTDITFDEATEKSTGFFENFGAHIDDAALRVKLFIAPFRTLVNGLTGVVSTVALSITGIMEGFAGGLQLLASAVPESLGGDKMRRGVAGFRKILDDVQAGLVEQVTQDARDIANAWSTTLDYRVEGERRAAAASKEAAGVVKDVWEQVDAAGIVSNDEMRDAIVQAATDGTAAIGGIAEALELIDTANTVAQLEGLKAALFTAWQEGRLSLEDYQTAHNATVEKLRATKAEADTLTASMGKNAEEVRKLKAEQAALLEQYRGGSITLEEYQSKHNEAAEAIRTLSAETDGASAATGAAAAEVRKLKAEQADLLKRYRAGSITLEEYQNKHNAAAAAITKLSQASTGAGAAVSDLSEKFESLADVQQAISSAQTDVEFNKIRAALRKMLEDGTITGEQYNAELEKITARQKELKGAVEQTASAGREAGEQLTKSQQMYNAALEDSILTNEELRRISGQRMEEERRASGELMEMQRKGQVETQRNMEAMDDWASSVLSSAREPLAQMSAAALEAYDKLLGISSVSVGIDTSGLEATRASLQGVADQLDNVKAAEMELLTKGNQNGLSGWMLDVQRASLQTQKAYLGQKASLQSLMERYQSGEMDLKSFISAANGAAGSLSLLDDSDLSSLKSALQSAEQQMEALGDSSRNTLDSLRAELANLNGDVTDANEQRFTQRRRELEAQRAEAKAAGNDKAVGDLNEAIRTLASIENKTQHDAREKARQEAAKVFEEAQAAAKAAAPAKTEPTTVVRLEVGNKQLNVEVPQGQQSQLLDMLRDAGLRTI